MSIHDAVRLGLENNLGIKVSRVDDVIAQRQVVVEQAVFDPFFNAGANYAKNRDPTVSILQEAQVGQIGVSPSEITQYYVSVTGKHVLGTQYSL
jgi:hypothetical protein